MSTTYLQLDVYAALNMKRADQVEALIAKALRELLAFRLGPGEPVIVGYSVFNDIRGTWLGKSHVESDFTRLYRFLTPPEHESLVRTLLYVQFIQVLLRRTGEQSVWLIKSTVEHEAFSATTLVADVQGLSTGLTKTCASRGGKLREQLLGALMLSKYLAHTGEYGEASGQIQVAVESYDSEGSPSPFCRTVLAWLCARAASVALKARPPNLGESRRWAARLEEVLRIGASDHVCKWRDYLTPTDERRSLLAIHKLLCARADWFESQKDVNSEYAECLQEFTALANEKLQARVLNYLAMFHAREKRWEDALKFWDRALHIDAKQNRDVDGETYASFYLVANATRARMAAEHLSKDSDVIRKYRDLSKSADAFLDEKERFMLGDVVAEMNALVPPHDGRSSIA